MNLKSAGTKASREADPGGGALGKAGAATGSLSHCGCRTVGGPRVSRPIGRGCVGQAWPRLASRPGLRRVVTA